jgi:arginyl-tRNA--protein-N-Asp/Glu arginylyltransferase
MRIGTAFDPFDRFFLGLYLQQPEACYLLLWLANLMKANTTRVRRALLAAALSDGLVAGIASIYMFFYMFFNAAKPTAG